MSSLRRWLSPIAGVLTAVFVAVVALHFAAIHSSTPPTLLFSAMAYVVGTFAAGFVAARLLAKSGPEATSKSLQVATAAAWAAPVTAFGGVMPGLALFTLLIYVGSVTVLGRAFFGTYPRKTIQNPSLWAFLTSLALQAGLVIRGAGYGFPGAILLILSAAILAWMYDAASALTKPSFENILRRSLPVLLLITLFVAAGFTRFLRIRLDLGGGGSVARGSDGRAEEPADEAGLGVGGSYRGVILFPDVQRHTIIVPPLPALQKDIFRLTRDNPLSIPFFGAYWFFQRPSSHPPRNSVTVRGTPDTMGFRAFGNNPLIMEAHQNLGILVDMNCCSRIDMAVSNADRFTAGSVGVELILVNTRLPGRPSQKLDQVWIASTSPARLGPSRVPVPEVLKFPLPASPAIEKFDQFDIRFHLAPHRASHSARISIDRFQLIPKSRSDRARRAEIR